MTDRTALIADADIAFRTAMANGLADCGFSVTQVGSVGEAFETITCGRFDALVSELSFADGTGIDIVARFHGRYPDPPALILSAFGDLRHAIAAARAGAVDFLVKPSSAAIVAQALRTPRDQPIPPPETAPSGEDVRWDQIDRVLRSNAGCISEAARQLRIDRRTLQRILRRRGIPPARR